MNQENKYILLDIVLKNGSINRLIRNGVKYEHIPDFISLLSNEKYISYENEKIILTEKGLIEHNTLASEFKKINKAEWIEPDEKKQIAPLEKNVIFVPKQNELTF